MRLRHVAPVLALFGAMAAPVPAADYGRGVLVGKVTNTTNRTLDRRIFVETGSQKWALHVNDTAEIFHAGRRVSIHDIDTTSYIKATGRRIGRLRLKAYRIDIIGDRAAYRRSRIYRRSAPEGYYVVLGR
jgi:hypothetical protein